MKRILLGTGAALGGALTFVLSAAAGVFLHSSTPSESRLLATEINAALKGVFKGRLEVQGLKRLGFGGVEGVRAALYDPTGRRVIFVDGVRARIGLPALAWAMVSGKSDIPITIFDGHIEQLEVDLEKDPATGDLTLLDALASPNPPSPTPSTKHIIIRIDDLYLDHAHVFGAFVDQPHIDAELSGARVDVFSSPDKTSIGVKPFELVAHEPLNGPADLRARVEGSFTTPSASGHGVDARLVFAGRLGEVEATIDGTMKGDRVDAVADVPETQPAAIVELFPTVPVNQPVSAHLEAHGDLSALRPTATVDVGDGVVSLDGNLSLGDDEKRADVRVSVRNLEPRGFAATAPSGKVSADLRAMAVMKKGGGVLGTYSLRTLPAVIADQGVPETNTAGRFTASSIEGAMAIEEAGAPADVSFDLHDGEGGKVVDFDAHVQANDLAAVPRIRRVALAGSATVRVNGRVALSTSSVDAHVEGGATNVSRGDVHAEFAKVKGHVHGPFADPIVDAVVVGEGIHVGGRAFTRVAVTTQGSVTKPFVTASVEAPDMPHLDLLAGLDLTRGLQVNGAEMRLVRKGVVAHVSAKSVRAEDGVLTVDGAVIEGLGKPIDASVSIGPTRTTIRARGDDVDLARVATLADDIVPVRKGHAALDVDLVEHGTLADGHLKLDVTHAAFQNTGDANAHVALDFSGHSVKGQIDADASGAGKLALTLTKLDLAGSPLAAASWKGATFDADLHSNVDLAKLAEALPGRLPFDKMAGLVTLAAKLTRTDAREAPTVAVDVSTRGLDLAGVNPYPPDDQDHPHEQVAVGPPKYPWEIAGLDVAASVRADGTSGKTSIDVRLFDLHGDLAKVAAQSDLPLTTLLHDPAHAKELVADKALTVHLETPERALESLPPVIRLPAVRGFMSLALDVTGTATAPHVALKVHGRDLRSTEPHAAVPLDVVADVTYDDKNGDAHLQVMRPASGVESVVMDAHATVAAAFDDLRAGGPPKWTAGADVQFSGFPLEAVPMLAQRKIQGGLVGDVKLTGLHEDARVEAKLSVPGLRLDDVVFPKSSLAVTLEKGDAKVTAEVDNPGGSLRTDVQAGLVWGSAVAPAPDEHRPVDVTLLAKGFRARALMPFLADAVNELDGNIDANAKIRIDPGFTHGKMVGSVVLTHGRLELPALGQELHDVTASVDIKPWGTVNVQKISADAMTGHLDAWGNAKLDGFDFVSAEGHLKIADGQQIPITLEGVPLGQAFGNVDVFAQRAKDGKTIDVTAKIPNLTASLPQATGHSVQGTDDDSHVEFGIYNARKQFVLVPLHEPQTPRSPSATHLHVAVQMGNILVRRAEDLRIILTGSPVIDVTDKTHVTGKIILRRGMVNLYGKKFELDSGTVSFTGGDASNPQLLVTAHFDAADGTRVYADVTGPVRTIKVTLRSEPSHTQNEILSLILFGSIEGETGTPPPDQQGNAETEAAGVASGFVSQGLDKMLDGVSPFEIATKLDTSNAEDPRPEVDVQVSQDVLLDITYNLGLPPPGDNPDRVLATVDWHFYKSWSVLATVGDMGSSILDLLWQHRY